MISLPRFRPTPTTAAALLLSALAATTAAAAAHPDAAAPTGVRADAVAGPAWVFNGPGATNDA